MKEAGAIAQWAEHMPGVQVWVGPSHPQKLPACTAPEVAPGVTPNKQTKNPQ